MKYILDTSFFINLPNVYHDTWNNGLFTTTLLEHLSTDFFILIESVVDEIGKKDDEVKTFIKEVTHHKGEIYLKELNKVMESYQSFSNKAFGEVEVSAFMQKADPHLIAFALWQKEKEPNIPVYIVSDERRSATPSQKLDKIKIPEVCDRLDIKHLLTGDMLYRIGSKQL
jgi:hypothetical protein